MLNISDTFSVNILPPECHQAVPQPVAELVQPFSGQDQPTLDQTQPNHVPAQVMMSLKKMFFKIMENFKNDATMKTWHLICEVFTPPSYLR